MSLCVFFGGNQLQLKAKRAGAIRSRGSADGANVSAPCPRGSGRWRPAGTGLDGDAGFRAGARASEGVRNAKSPDQFVRISGSVFGLRRWAEILAALRVRRDSGADALDRMREKIAPDFLVDEPARGILDRRAARLDRTVRALRRAFHVGIGDEAPRVSEGRLGLIDVYDRAELMQAEQFPRAAVVVAGPSAVEDVADAMGVSRITVYNYLNAIHR